MKISDLYLIFGLSKFYPLGNMIKRVFFLFISIILVSSFYAQSPKNNNIVLTQLGLRDTAIEATLAQISEYIRMKPQGLRFPISKVVFSKIKGGLTYTVEGIDNSWASLFNHGESTYGYVVVGQRLYVVMGLTEESPNLNEYFYVIGSTKSFSRNVLPPTGLLRRPKWIFDYADGRATVISDSDLDILEK